MFDFSLSRVAATTRDAYKQNEQLDNINITPNTLFYFINLYKFTLRKNYFKVINFEKQAMTTFKPTELPTDKYII